MEVIFIKLSFFFNFKKIFKCIQGGKRKIEIYQGRQKKKGTKMKTSSSYLPSNISIFSDPSFRRLMLNIWKEWKISKESSNKSFASGRDRIFWAFPLLGPLVFFLFYDTSPVYSFGILFPSPLTDENLMHRDWRKQRFFATKTSAKYGI